MYLAMGIVILIGVLTIGFVPTICIAILIAILAFIGKRAGEGKDNL